MPKVQFTSHLSQHIVVPWEDDVPGDSVKEVLEVIFGLNPKLRSYIIDDQDSLRFHVVIFVDGEAILDRKRLSDTLRPGADVFVMQALSGG